MKSMVLVMPLFLGLVLLPMAGALEAQEAQETQESQTTPLTLEQAEKLGVEVGPAPGLAADAPRTPRKRGRRVQGGLPDFLLIPDASNDRVMAFDATTGDLIDGDFIPPDPTNLSTPINAILGPNNDTILVSDQVEDVVQEYDLNGNFLGTFAPAGGPNTAILDNVRGIALRANGNLLVTVGTGSNQDSVAEFDTSGAYLGNFVAIGGGGLDSPFDVLPASDLLVSAIDSDAVHRYDLTTGAFIADLATVDNFPEQIALASNGNILVANFLGTQEGILELMPNGTLVAIYDPPGADGNYRGVYELPNGNLLVSNSTGVHEISRANTLIETKYSGSSRFIELIENAVPVELQSFSVE